MCPTYCLITYRLLALNEKMQDFPGTPAPAPAGDTDSPDSPSPTEPTTPEDTDTDSQDPDSDEVVEGTVVSNGAPAATTLASMAANNLFVVVMAGGLALLPVVF